MPKLIFDPATQVVNRKVNLETLYIGRGSIWGNPFTCIRDRKTKAEFLVDTREQSVRAYRAYFLRNPVLLYRLPELNGHKLGCFCKPQNCHGDILLRYLRGLIAYLNNCNIPIEALDFSDQRVIVSLEGYTRGNL